MGIAFWSYDNNSEGLSNLRAKLLGLAQSTTVIPHNVRVAADYIINWGFQRIPNVSLSNPHCILNKPEKIINASNKIECFTKLSNAQIGIPAFTQSKSEAQTWARNGHVVFCRTNERAKYGEGIVIAQGVSSEVVDAPLYTKNIPCKREYRVYVFGGKMIGLVSLIKVDNALAQANPYIRNWKTGWGFTRSGVTIPTDIRIALGNLAVTAVETLGLDFGAVDIVRDFNDNLYVLEVNTAPGIEGITAEEFAHSISEHYQNFLNTARVVAPITEAVRTAPRDTPRVNTVETTGLNLTPEEIALIMRNRQEQNRNRLVQIASHIRDQVRGLQQEEWTELYTILNPRR